MFLLIMLVKVGNLKIEMALRLKKKQSHLLAKVKYTYVF